MPTWRRPEKLRRCLAGLAAQRRPPDEVVVVARDDDAATWSLLEQAMPEMPALRGVSVPVAGLSASLNAGLDAIEGDLVAITDDDAVPRPDWLERVEAHMRRDPRVGGVGGRDWQIGLERETRRTVGKIRLYGRVVGNHHLGAGRPREVDMLKGANMAFREAAVRAVRVREGLRGSGNQVHTDLDLSLKVKRAGWSLVYDPAVAVDHHHGQRFDEDQRVDRPLVALENEVYNETVVLLSWAPWWRKPLLLGYGLLVGTRQAPGPLLALERVLRGGRVKGAFLGSTKARLEAARDVLRGDPE